MKVENWVFAIKTPISLAPKVSEIFLLGNMLFALDTEVFVAAGSPADRPFAALVATAATTSTAKCGSCSFEGREAKFEHEDHTLTSMRTQSNFAEKESFSRKNRGDVLGRYLAIVGSSRFVLLWPASDGTT